MEKCKWKDGGLYGCNKFNNAFDGNYIYHTMDVTRIINPYDSNIFMVFDFCPFCGADIRKPKPEVVVKRSGGTWVGRKDDVDYIWTGETIIDFSTSAILRGRLLHGDDDWELISEVDITDDIAKLRPIVIWHDNKCVLYGIEGNGVFPTICYNLVSSEVDGYKLAQVRLATVEDLEEDK